MTPPRPIGLPSRQQDPTIPTKVRMQRTTRCKSSTSTQYGDQRSPKNRKTSASDHQEDQPRWPPCWNQELTQRDNKEVHIIPSANREYPRHQASFSILLPYDQPGKRQQTPHQEHPLQQKNKYRHSKLAKCVYNLPPRSLYSHQHKPEPTTVTQCLLPMTAATPGGRPPYQQEVLMKKKKHYSHRRERPQGRKVKQYPQHQDSLSLLLPYLQPGK